MDIKINITHGTLKDRIPLSRVNGINSLSLIGSINGDDIEFIRRITGGYDWTDNSKFPGPLEVLDLSNCKFVSGGIYKHTEFMGPYKHSVSLHQFLQMWVSHEYAGNGYGLKFIADDEIPNEMFLGCFKLKKIILPRNIKRIGNLSFYDCINLEALYIGNSLSLIGDYAFAKTYHLKEIHIKSNIPPTLSKYAFGDPKYHDNPDMNPKNKITLFVPKGCASDYWLQWGFDKVIEE
jgi:hypothetical protein